MQERFSLRYLSTHSTEKGRLATLPAVENRFTPEALR
jgi:hypothetical protein